MQNYSNEFLKKAHKGSSCHKSEIQNTDLCGCFYCCETFLPTEINDWIDEGSRGETAECPKCGIDSVLSSNWPINDNNFLTEMHNFWF